MTKWLIHVTINIVCLMSEHQAVIAHYRQESIGPIFNRHSSRLIFWAIIKLSANFFDL